MFTEPYLSKFIFNIKIFILLLLLIKILSIIINNNLYDNFSYI